MSRDTSSVIVRADMSAFEFREAAWAAVDADDDDDRCEPDPSVLSDRTLAIVMRYRDRDLPSGSHLALEAEWRRRGTMRDGPVPSIAIALMALVGGGGLIAVWMFFVG